MSRLPVESLPARLTPINLEGTEVHHLPDWSGYDDPKRLQIIRQIAMMRGRDPRIANLAIDIIKKARVQPRDYKGQAQALLAWVQNPKNIYYVNEPGERLQDPIFTIKHGFGDCFAEDTLVLREDMELVPIQDVKVGDRIWGSDHWSVVSQTWRKGSLPITEIRLNNGSTLRLTEGHKVWVRSCEKHGPLCPDLVSKQANCKKRNFSWVRIYVKDLCAGMELRQPERIKRPAESSMISREGAWFVGAFIADGWAEDSRVMISGQDGNWKGSTKKRVQGRGEKARNKRIPVDVLAHGDLTALDEGLKLDSSRNSRGVGWTFGTTSPYLAVQYRVLQRMLGRSTSVAAVSGHRGFGLNTIYRIGVRNPQKTRDKRLRITQIKREVEQVPCYDIATDDNCVYLPEADCTVSQCDDQVLTLAALLESIRLPWKLVLAGMKNGKKVRFIEGGTYPSGVTWGHIYCMVGTPPFRPSQWYFCETTINGVPMGWDVVDGDKSYLPELDSSGPKEQTIVFPGPASPFYRPAPLPPVQNRSPAYAMAWGSPQLSFQPSVVSNPISPVAVATGAAVGESVETGTKLFTPVWTARLFAGIVTAVCSTVLSQLALDAIRPKIKKWQAKRAATSTSPR